METLNSDLVEEIVRRIPPQSISEAKFVCKTWEDILRRHHNELGILFSFGLEKSSYASSDMFNQSRSSVQLYYGDFDDIKSIGGEKYSYTRDTVEIDHPPIGKYEFSITLVGSCNGLVCLTIPHHDLFDPVQVCNPYTGEYVNLPRLLKHPRGRIVSGFGYLRSTNEYKVLRIYYAPSTRNNIVGLVQVYTLGDRRGWRDIGTIDYQVRCSTFFTNESIYLVLVKREDLSNNLGVVSFSLAKEEFRLVPPPPCIRKPGTVHRFDISILGGDLYFLNSNLYKFVELWSLKKKEECDDNSWNWNKEFNMDWPQERDGQSYFPAPELFGLTKSNEILYWYYDGLHCYDPKTRASRLLLKEDKTLKEYFEAIPHMNTNVSLKEMGVRSKMRRRKTVRSNYGQAQS